MKVSAILVSSLLSWVVAYPGLLDWQKDADKLMGYVVTKEVNGGTEDNQRHVKAATEGEPQGLIEKIKLWRNQFIPLNLFDNEKLDDGGIFGILRGRNDGKNEASPFPMGPIFGKDNIFTSMISNAVATAGSVIEWIKSNFAKGNGLPFLPFGKELTGVVRDFDKSDSDHSKGHESRGDDNSRVSSEAERTGTGAEKEGHAEGYQGSAIGGAGGVAGEKHAIHSADSRGSSKGDAKTATTVKTAPGDSRLSTEPVEKSTDAKKVTEGIKKIDEDAGKNDRTSSKDKKDSRVSEGANGKENVEKISGGIRASTNADKKVEGGKTKEVHSDTANDGKTAGGSKKE